MVEELYDAVMNGSDVGILEAIDTVRNLHTITTPQDRQRLVDLAKYIEVAGTSAEFIEKRHEIVARRLPEVAALLGVEVAK